MRIRDLDHDMSDVIPAGGTAESEFLFRRMQEETLRALGARRGARVLDLAAGVGQDGRALAGRGISAVGTEPSKRMTDLARIVARRDGSGSPPQRWVRAWSEALPFRSASFDAAFCKGALDHFDDPLRCIAEAARVTRPGGRVVFSVANFDSLGCRLSRRWDRMASARRKPPEGTHGVACRSEGLTRQVECRSEGLAPGFSSLRRSYDVPSDHFTRYDPELLRSDLERYLVIESWIGISLLWNVRGWGRLLRALPQGVARVLLAIGDRLGRAVPAWSDVIVAAGRPRRAAAHRAPSDLPPVAPVEAWPSSPRSARIP
jgi:SAM-dependent methyltransferase